MMISLLSGVVIRVLKICISFTFPLCPCASIVSPTLKGLNNKIITPPAKFCNVPLNAIPMATPAEANKAIKELVSMPNTLIMVMSNTKLSVMPTRLLTKEYKEASTCLFCMIVQVRRNILFTSQRPMIKITRAISSLEPSDIPKSIILLMNTSQDRVEVELRTSSIISRC